MRRLKALFGIRTRAQKKAGPRHELILAPLSPGIPHINWNGIPAEIRENDKIVGMHDVGTPRRGKWIGPGSCSAFRPPSPLNTKSGSLRPADRGPLTRLTRARQSGGATPADDAHHSPLKVRDRGIASIRTACKKAMALYYQYSQNCLIQSTACSNHLCTHFPPSFAPCTCP